MRRTTAVSARVERPSAQIRREASARRRIQCRRDRMEWALSPDKYYQLSQYQRQIERRRAL